MSKIKFYSEYDMANGWELKKIIEKIKIDAIESNWDITDLLEFHNILKYTKINSFSDYIAQETSIDVKSYEKKIRQKIGGFIGSQKDNIIKLYDEIDFDDAIDFFEILENYKLYKRIDIRNFREFLEKESVHVYPILKFKRLTEYFNEPIKDAILSNPMNAETILSKYLKEEELYLPSIMTEAENISLIADYIAAPEVNLNVLRTIIHFPTNTGLNIPDKIKLSAKKKAEEEQEKVFNNGVGIESEVRISYPKYQDEEIIVAIDDRTIDIKVSRNWIEDNLDYPTLWNNFIYLFGFVDGMMRLVLDSKESESSVIESAIRPQAEYLYYESTSFMSKEMVSNTQIYTYVNVLNIFGVRLEEMIEWFFDIYMKEEFQIDDFIVKMPSSEASYFEKCRTILPEIDRIFKQYNNLIEDGKIDQELIQMSSSSFKIKDITSFNKMKYVYSSSEWFKTASYLLFSDQSSIFYLPKQDNQYKNFFNLLISEKLTRKDFQEHQLKRMQWLFDKKLIRVNKMEYLEFVDQTIIYVLKELYYKEVMSLWHYPREIQILVKELGDQGLVDFESSLFSKNEQDFFDFYLNKSKFTNGHDIRNKYLHGTNTNDEKQYESDYYLILKLFVIIVIKINDDLYLETINTTNKMT